MAVGEARPGYELWRPNREKPEAITTKFVVVILLLASAGVAGLATITGWSLLQGGAGMGGAALFFFVLFYIVFAFFVARWNRGVLPLSAAFAVLLIIFAAVAAPSWFARDKSGFDDPLIPEDLIGLLILVLIPLQVLLIAISMIAFNQDWHVEEERPIGSGADYGAGSEGVPPDEEAPQPA
jgi:hypothetical protein